ncbi:MAG: hypothetical protein HOP02_12210 [Methylococcaceae bacterium]|nr:hypothetical protein [Methylococcaceae bacterium]
MQIKNKSYKNLAMTGLAAVTALSNLVGASVANAVPVANVKVIANKGSAQIVLHQDVLATFKGDHNFNGRLASSGSDLPHFFLYINEFFEDAEFVYPKNDLTECNPSGGITDYTLLCNRTPTDVYGLVKDSLPFLLPVVPLAKAPYQAGNIGSNWNYTWNSYLDFNPVNGGSIGLAGAFRVRSALQADPSLSVRWGELSLKQTGATWVLYDNLHKASLFELTNVVANPTFPGNDPNGLLSLSADLKFGASAWGAFMGAEPLAMTAAEKQTIIGHINLNVNSCALPAWQWKNQKWPTDSLTIAGKHYSKATLRAILNTPSNGNSYLNLVKQYMAVLLSIADGEGNLRNSLSWQLAATNVALKGRNIETLNTPTVDAFIDKIANDMEIALHQSYARIVECEPLVLPLKGF